MIGNCDKCELPGLSQDLVNFRNTVQTSHANMVASTSPTEAKSYAEAKKEALKNLRDTQEKFTDFVNIWRDTCGGCEFRA